MKNLVFKSIEEIVVFAINEENDAHIFYANQAKITTNFELKLIWEQLSHDEIRHKMILTSLLEQMEKEEEHNIRTYSTEDIKDFVPIEIPTKEYSETEKIIISAVEKENDAYYLYLNLAKEMTDSAHKHLLLTLAKEELKHKQSLLKELNLL